MSFVHVLRLNFPVNMVNTETSNTIVLIVAKLVPSDMSHASSGWWVMSGRDCSLSFSSHSCHSKLTLNHLITAIVV